MSLAKRFSSVFISIVLVAGLLPYSAYADPAVGSIEDGAVTQNDESVQYEDDGIAAYPDEDEFAVDSDDSAAGEGTEVVYWGDDSGSSAGQESGENANSNSQSAYAEGRLAIWAAGLDGTPADEVYPTDANQAQSYANGSGITPMSFSEEMTYFCKYESSCNYDQGLSWGDDYHAMGYFQFDNRYGLGTFLQEVYNYNPSKYWALKQIGDIYGWDVYGNDGSTNYYKDGRAYSLREDLNWSWHQAYAADPAEFSELQNGWAYTEYYSGSLGARGILGALGINLDNRPDCIKGLCWGMVNLFGVGGGAEYINQGRYYGASWFFKNSGINDSMTNKELVTTLCDYVVNNVADRYPSQPQYHQGWQNRYKNEKSDCLNYLAKSTYTIDVKPYTGDASTVTSGEYVIKSSLADRLVLQASGSGATASSALSVHSSDMSWSQVFQFEKDEPTGLTRIKDKDSGKYLSLNSFESRYSPNIAQREYSASDNSQLWAVEDAGSGTVAIYAYVNSNYCLDVSGGSSAEGTSVGLYLNNGTAAQKWTLYSASVSVEGGKTVDDGVYTISLKGSSGKVLDVASGSTSDGANVQVWESNGTAAQKFRFECGSDGFYTITNLKSGKALDCASGNLVPGANAQQWSSYGGDAQKWAVRANSDGSYSLICKANGLTLDASGSSKGSNVQLWAADDERNQSFELRSAKVERTVADGSYIVSSAIDRSKTLDVAGGSRSNGARIQVYESNMTAAQSFKFAYDEDTGYYTITNAGSGKVLDATNGKVSNGVKIQQWEPNGTLVQCWEVVADGEGYRICSAVDPNKVFDVAGGSSQNGTGVQLWEANGTNAQKFYLVSSEHEDVAQCEDLGLNDWYEIVPTASSSVCLDVSGASKSDGAQIQLYRNNKTIAQLFKFQYSDGYYRIVSLNSNKAIELKNGSVVPGVGAEQTSVTESGAQQFRIDVNEDGSYTFTCAANALRLGTTSLGSGTVITGEKSDSESACESFKLVKRDYAIPEGLVEIATSLDGGKDVDVADASDADGANVQLYTSNGTAAQKWQVSHVSGKSNVYRFESASSGKYMAVSGSNVCQRAYSENSTGQMWMLVGIDAGSYSFMNLENNKVLDVASASTANGANIQTYPYNGTAAQKFNLKSTDCVKTGMYVFHSRANYGQVLDVSGGSSADGANIQSYSSNGSGAQKWSIVSNGDGTYRIVNAANGKVFDVANGSAYNGANVQQYSWNGSNAQKWYAIYQGGGGMSFESALDRSLVLSLASASPSNCTNLQLAKKDGSTAQRFSFEETTYTPPMPSDRQAMLDRIYWESSGTQWLIGVDRSQHRVGVFRGNSGNWSLQYWWSCVTGAPSSPTITGTYRTTGYKRDSLDTDSRAIYCTQIYGGYFFHSVLSSESELGQSLSHGCIRMAWSSASWIHDNIYAGTTVVIYN